MECNHTSVGKHNKIFETGVLLASNPPQRRWICSLCYEEGTEFVGSFVEEISLYDRLKGRKKDKQHNGIY